MKNIVKMKAYSCKNTRIRITRLYLFLQLNKNNRYFKYCVIVFYHSYFMDKTLNSRDVCTRVQISKKLALIFSFSEFIAISCFVLKRPQSQISTQDGTLKRLVDWRKITATERAGVFLLPYWIYPEIIFFFVVYNCLTGLWNPCCFTNGFKWGIWEGIQ